MIVLKKRKIGNCVYRPFKIRMSEHSYKVFDNYKLLK